jgi:hypothetical protein
LIYFEELFDKFKSLAEESWPGLQILNLDVQRNLPGEPIELGAALYSQYKFSVFF